jgi:hypothetical protein
MDGSGGRETNNELNGIVGIQFHRQFNISSSNVTHNVDEIPSSEVGAALHTDMFD